ncbi:MAG: IS4 family transposase [Armatimonadota bacterium]|nr:IS4 family transposase [Armatimonadota bacterium]
MKTTPVPLENTHLARVNHKNRVVDKNNAVTAIEGALRECLGMLEPEESARQIIPGRPAILPATVLWAGLLVCIIRGFSHQIELWRMLTLGGIWNFPVVDVTPMAIYNRLRLTSSKQMQLLFDQVTEAIQEHFPQSLFPVMASFRGQTIELASFATSVVAIDQSKLDAVLRKLKVLRGLPKGESALMPGSLNCLFDIRQQQWKKVIFSPQPHQNERTEAYSLLEGLKKGALVLADLGYFGFAWFDTLTQDGHFYVSRMKEKVSYSVEHTFYQGGSSAIKVIDQLVYLGAYRADRAAHPVRLVQLSITNGASVTTWRYLTNILDPSLLPVWQIVELYRRRWDIEMVFNLLKTHLGLHLLYSGVQNTILQQVYATFIIAQVVLSMRNEIARKANVDVREVSMALLVRWAPRLAAMGRDPIAEFVDKGHKLGFIRPFRGKSYELPEINEEEYVLPERLPPKRKPRYGPPKPGEPKPSVRKTRSSQIPSLQP